MSKSRIIFAGVALFITLICWSLSSPINSHGDERYYIGSIWCAKGYNENCLPLGLTESKNEIAFVNLGLCVPIGIEESFKRLLVDSIENACQYAKGNKGSLGQFLSSINNRIEMNGYVATDFNSVQYPTGYQKVMNLFATKNGPFSILVMRIFNSLLFCALFSFLLITTERNIGAYALIAFLLISVPHVLFTIASITPMSWSFTGNSLGWLFFFNLLTNSQKLNLRLILSVIGWLISFTLVVTSRYDAIIIWIFTNLTILVLYFSSKLQKIKIRRYALILAMYSLLLYFFEKQFGLVDTFKYRFLNIDPIFFNKPWNQLLAIGGTVKLIFATPLRVLGLESLGWFAIYVPGFVAVAGLILFSIFVINLSSRKNYTQIALLLLIVGFTFGAIYFQIFGQLFRETEKLAPFYYIRTDWRGDTFFSGRHFIGLFMFLLVAHAIFSKKSLAIFQTSTQFVLVNLLCFTHAISLITVGSIFRENPDWFWFKSPLGVNLITFVGSLTFLAFTYTATSIIVSAKQVAQTLENH